MKVFVSTDSTQGDEPGDFCFVPEGELVGRYHVVCDCDQFNGSGCGCGSAFSGFTTHHGTTTAMVVERDITEEQWRAELVATLDATGWGPAMSAEELARFVDDLVDHDLRSAAKLPVGAVLGRRAWKRGRNTVDNLVYRGVHRDDLRRSA